MVQVGGLVSPQHTEAQVSVVCVTVGMMEGGLPGTGAMSWVLLGSYREFIARVSLKCSPIGNQLTGPAVVPLIRSMGLDDASGSGRWLY